jgi:hypothetical protein
LTVFVLEIKDFEKRKATKSETPLPCPNERDIPNESTFI